jgi:hypothetical protein
MKIKVALRTSVDQMITLSLRLADARYRPSGENERHDIGPECPQRTRCIFVSSFSKGFQMRIDLSVHPLEEFKKNGLEIFIITII